MTVVKTFVAIVPAAGIGSRMQSTVAKQYLQIANKTVIEHTLDALLSHPQIRQVVVVLHPQDDYFHTLNIAKHPAVDTVIGGNERVDSVLKGLLHCQVQNKKPHSDSTDAEWVLVHDAARPCVTNAELNDLLSIAESCDGGILAIPVADTIKLAARNTKAESSAANIDKTVDRSSLWQAQTPQFFPLVRLISAIQTAQQHNVTITDEASAMEHINAKVKLIEGRSTNIKITRPSDLALAEFYLNNNDNKQRGTLCSV